MKQYVWIVIVIIPLSLGLIQNSFGAIASSTVLEVRTTGSDLNGGGFNQYRGSPYFGTDYSNQNNAQESYTTLSCAATATKLFLSGAETFNQSSTGNLIQITSGTNFLKGFYEITSIASSQAVNIDVTASNGIYASSGNGKMGGGLNSLWALQSTATNPIVAGNKIWIKNGTYVKAGSSTAVLSLGVAGGQGTPIIWEGYNSIRGDRPLDDNRPYFDGANSATNCLHTNSITTNIFNYIRFGRATGNNITTTGGQATHFYGCKSSNAGGAGTGWTTGGWNFIQCEANNNGGAGFIPSAGTSFAYYCYSHDNAGGFILAGNGLIGGFNIAESNTGAGFSFTTGSPYLLGNIAYNNTGAAVDGFIINGNTTSVYPWFNNISISNGRDGFRRNATTNSSLIFDYNCYQGNSSAGLTNITAGVHDITSDPLFVDPLNGNFAFKTGSPCIRAGLTQNIPFSSSTYPVLNLNWNMGVDQSDHSGKSYSFVN